MTKAKIKPVDWVLNKGNRWSLNLCVTARQSSGAYSGKRSWWSGWNWWCRHLGSISFGLPDRRAHLIDRCACRLRGWSAHGAIILQKHYARRYQCRLIRRAGRNDTLHWGERNETCYQRCFTLDELALASGHQAAQQHFGKIVVTLYVPMIEKLNLVCIWQQGRKARALDTEQPARKSSG